jgi:hypothetical protein
MSRPSPVNFLGKYIQAALALMGVVYFVQGRYIYGGSLLAASAALVTFGRWIDRRWPESASKKDQWPYFRRTVRGRECYGIDPSGLYLIQVGEERRPDLSLQETPNSGSLSADSLDLVLSGHDSRTDALVRTQDR